MKWLAKGIFLTLLSLNCMAKELVPVVLIITEPYLELHIAASSEYRVEHILLTGEKIQLKKQYADWFYLIQSEKVYGWAPLKELLDNRIESFDMSFDEFLIHYEGELEFYLAFKTGFMDGDFVQGFEMGHQLSENMRIALSVRQVPGKISESRFITLDLDYIFGAVKTVKPFVTVGFGNLTNSPSAQVIGGEKVTSKINKLGLGMYFAESKRIQFSLGVYLYTVNKDAFSKNLQELSIGLKYDF